MKSRITIEVDYENNRQPVIQILQASSDDVRDSLIQDFTQMFGGSSWCNIKWITPQNEQGFTRIHISPIPPTEFKEQAKIMLEQDNLNDDFRNKNNAITQ